MAGAILPQAFSTLERATSRMVTPSPRMAARESFRRIELQTKEDLIHQPNAVAACTTHYQRTRPMYMLGSQMAQQHVDIVVNGMKTVEELTTEILNEIGNRPAIAHKQIERKEFT